MARRRSGQNKQLAVIEHARLAYKWAIDYGIAKEQAGARVGIA